MIIELECPKALYLELDTKAQKEKVSVETLAMRILRGVLFINSKIEGKKLSDSIVEYKTKLPADLVQKLHKLAESVGADENELVQDGIEDVVGLYAMLHEEGMCKPSEDSEGKYFTMEEVKEHCRLVSEQRVKDYVEKSCQEGGEFVLKLLHDFSKGDIAYDEAIKIISERDKEAS